MKIFCLTHRDYDIPNDGTTVPLLLGMNEANIDLKVRDLLPAISKENLLYNELEGEIYLHCSDILKDEDIVGITQYSCRPDLTYGQIRDILKDHKIIAHADYVGNIDAQYRACHWQKPWNELLTALKWKSDIPQAKLEDILHNQGTLFTRHIFITDVDTFKAYMKWVLPIVGELMNRLQIRNVAAAKAELAKVYQIPEQIPYQTRILGYITERLFSIWIYSNFDVKKDVYIPQFKTFPKVELN